MVDILAVKGDERRVLVCDMPRGVDKQTLIRGFLNGETLLVEMLRTSW